MLQYHITKRKVEKMKNLQDHQEAALIDALAILNNVKRLGIEVQPNTISSIEAMLGVKGMIPDIINLAIDEQEENRRQALKEEKEHYADYGDQS